MGDNFMVLQQFHWFQEFTRLELESDKTFVLKCFSSVHMLYALKHSLVSYLLPNGVWWTADLFPTPWHGVTSTPRSEKGKPVFERMQILWMKSTYSYPLGHLSDLLPLAFQINLIDLIP